MYLGRINRTLFLVLPAFKLIIANSIFYVRDVKQGYFAPVIASRTVLWCTRKNAIGLSILFKRTITEIRLARTHLITQKQKGPRKLFLTETLIRNQKIAELMWKDSATQKGNEKVSKPKLKTLFYVTHQKTQKFGEELKIVHAASLDKIF